MIDGYPDYAISDHGRVLSLRYNSLLAPRINSYGNHRVVLYKDKVPHDFYVHHLVAFAFTTGYSAGMRVRHEDDDNGNNALTNLRFYRRGMGQLKTPDAPRGRRVRIIESGMVFRTVEDCARYLGGDTSSIYRVLKGQRLSHKGHTFDYLEVDNAGSDQ